MEIVLASTGMPFGPNTMKYASLGGSETACFMAAKEMAKKGHIVTIFTPLPGPDRPDFTQNGMIDEDNVRFLDIQNYQNYVGQTEIDLCIIVRNPQLAMSPIHAHKTVLWMHDIATISGMGRAFEQMAWNIDEVWCPSKFHREQISSTVNYPKEYIHVVRNGIVPCPQELDISPVRVKGDLVYAARPERGLFNLLRDGGVMEALPEFNLKVSTYDNPNHKLDGLYQYLFSRVQELPNVESPAVLKQGQMRQRLRECEAYIYPTQFEETSCILARECIETKTPILTTREGALPETLKDCGLYYEDWRVEMDRVEYEKGSPEWCASFADFVQWALRTDEGQERVQKCVEAMALRKDLYWDGPARKMIRRGKIRGRVRRYSRALSLYEDGDVIACKALLDEAGYENLNWAEKLLYDDIVQFYPFLLPEEHEDYVTLSDYYNNLYYPKEIEDQVLVTDDRGLDGVTHTDRYQQIARECADLKPGSLVVEYGAGQGHLCVNLAHQFPELEFRVYDFTEAIIAYHDQYKYGKLENLTSKCAGSPADVKKDLDGAEPDLLLCSEVLEHNIDPWTMIDELQDLTHEGGRMVFTTPFGPWERETWWKKLDRFHVRNHIWHFTKADLRFMLKGKKDVRMHMCCQGAFEQDMRPLGQSFWSYTNDKKPIPRISPIEKAYDHRARHSCAAAIIAYNNEDTITKMLNSLNHKVRIIQIAHGPSTDNTLDRIKEWAQKHPHILVRVISVPRIAAPKEFGGTAKEGEAFGFADARKKSCEGLKEIVDWILWIDTDEFLIGHIGGFLRHSCIDALVIPQHHFTVEPRQSIPQMDRPARLFKTTRDFECKGRIHEHFELPEGGPGRIFILPHTDIGHIGYENEMVRRRRFDRNYPFLLWEHTEVLEGKAPARRLHHFLWFRDIIHRMRYAEQFGDTNMRVALAHEAIDYFNQNREYMGHFGGGIQNALLYLKEARKVLGEGMDLQVTFDLGDNLKAGLEGCFLDYEELEGIIRNILEPEFQARTSRYK